MTKKQLQEALVYALTNSVGHQPMGDTAPIYESGGCGCCASYDRNHPVEHLAVFDKVMANA